MSSFMKWNVQSTIRCKSGLVPSRMSAYFGISKLILYFPYCFHVPCTIPFTVYFCTVISMFRFFCYWFKPFNFVFSKDIPLVSWSNVQAVTAENKKQHTWSNIRYIRFQNCYFFSLKFILKEVLLKCTQTY